MAAGGPHISISAEQLFSVGQLHINNSMLTSVVVSCLLVIFAVWVKLSLRRTNRPTGIQNFAEWLIESLDNLIQSVTNDRRRTDLFFPLIATFFIIIIVNNWVGLLPGVGTIEVERNQEHVPLFRAATADLNMTIALGLTAVASIQFFGLKYLHLSYLKKFINFSNPINFFVGILEIVSELSKIISFAFRLFGNVFAGEVLLGVVTFLVPVIAPMPFYGLEVFVGFIQALVFMMLSLVLFNMATVSHDEH